ncbi:hypothetical protein [Streptomyces sp. CB02460]|uniref:hypothetical protein n=1 Tax=Streptomyces sp. CB02460 TaxID=1703941 RepID=UPI00093C2647|nr:hypothetical protein [Streptomyces sp. CB02460]OKJ77588.1 hypothetical protein AMK30_00815 [Streptomyces sp. CB02460]
MRVDDQGERIIVTMPREEFFLIQSLMSEALETGDPQDFATRVGATMDEVREILRSLPDLPYGYA